VLRTLLALAALTAATVSSPLALLVQSVDSLHPGRRVWLHAHNCYVENGQWADRIDRALATATRHLAIEQDIAWHVDSSTGRGRSVVSHEAKTTGTEPTLEAHFFDRIRPTMERALAENRRDTWPILVLHLDFKTNEPAHHEAIWELLGRHERWLTTAERVADERAVQPFAPGPLLRSRAEPGGHVSRGRAGGWASAPVRHDSPRDVSVGEDTGGPCRRGVRRFA
jgi:hypothetical protein